MKKNLVLLNKKEIRNIRDGHHLNSKYWQEWKNKLPALSAELIEIAIGMVISDACMYKNSTQALIKFEQGYKQEEFLLHLFYLFKGYCFMLEPGKRKFLYGVKKGSVKSLWFKTFSHYSFTEIWNLFYIDNSKKIINKNLIKMHLTARGLAYWIMGDGSLQSDKKTMILHTQSYSYVENLTLSKELNEKFGFRTEVIPHKIKYWVIKFNSKDATILCKLISPYVHSSLAYKIPVI